MSSTLLHPEVEAPEADTSTRPNRRTSAWALVMFAVGLVMALVVGPAVVPTGEGGAPAATAAAEEPDNRGAACYYPVAGWLVKERPCEDISHLPEGVQECLFAVFGAAAVAMIWGAPLAPAVAGTLVGCGGKLLAAT